MTFQTNIEECSTSLLFYLITGDSLVQRFFLPVRKSVIARLNSSVLWGFRNISRFFSNTRQNMRLKVKAEPAMTVKAVSSTSSDSNSLCSVNAVDWFSSCPFKLSNWLIPELDINVDRLITDFMMAIVGLTKASNTV